MTPPDLEKLITLAGSATATGPAGRAAHTRRAFELAHRARRLLEIAAETASRNRWNELNTPQGAAPKEPEARFAAACAAAVIKYPVYGEPKVYAALLDAVDCARLVSERLYHAWVDTQREVDPLPEPEPGVVHIAVPLAPGCSRVESLETPDEENAS